MKTKKLLYAAIPALTISLLVGCNKPKEVIPDSREREPATEIGDIINAWTDKLDSKELPLGLSNAYSHGEIIEDFGNEDNQSLQPQGLYSQISLLRHPHFCRLP